MKTVLLVVCSIWNVSLIGQHHLDDRICNCIHQNFKLIEVDYKKEIENIRLDLIHSEIISAQHESIIAAYKTIIEKGEISQARTVDNFLIEQTALSTIKHCISLITFHDNEYPPHPLYLLSIELAVYNSNLPDLDVVMLRQYIAKLIMRYYDEDQFANNSKLWNYFLVQYLFALTESEEMKELSRLSKQLFDTDPIDSLNSIFIGIEEETDKIFYNHSEISEASLCDSIINPILEGLEIVIHNSKQTSFGGYEIFYEKIKSCYYKARNTRAIEIFDEVYDNLITQEQQIIDQSLPFKVKGGP